MLETGLEKATRRFPAEVALPTGPSYPLKLFLQNFIESLSIALCLAPYWVCSSGKHQQLFSFFFI